MSDMVDFALEHACDDYKEYDHYQDGFYTPQEAYERGFVDELGEELFNE